MYGKIRNGKQNPRIPIIKFLSYASAIINGKNIPKISDTFKTKKHETIPIMKKPINKDIGSLSLSFFLCF